MYLAILLLMQAGDCELNPGPFDDSCSKFPCVVCNLPCTWEQRAIQCDECEGWYHSSCMGMNTLNYEVLGNCSISWTCCNCGLPNFSTSLFSQWTLETSNSFSSLSNVSEDDVGPLSPPVASSSPKCSLPKKQKPTIRKCKKPQPKRQLKVMVVNFQSVKNKVAGLAACLDIHEPDIVLGSETWLNPDVGSKELFPGNYTVIRKDRKDSHGGVLIALKNDLVFTHKPDLDANCEILWAQVQLVGCKTLTICSFYRPPDKKESQYLQELHDSLAKIENPNEGILWLGGDFNLGDINWTDQSIRPGPNPRSVCQQLIDIANNFNLEQVVNKPTRNQNILDLFFVNNETLVEKSCVFPGISDHDGIPIITMNLSPKRCKQKPKKIYLFHKANLEGMKCELREFGDEFVKKNTHKESVEILWSQFKENLSSTMDKFIPSKEVTSRNKVPWINSMVKRSQKQKQRAYNKARKSNNQEDWDLFKELERILKLVLLRKKKKKKSTRDVA
ncbi:uncharacterized protein [Amphiura filiformis]|uniref:uncharacterized protein n=1 Tax=Amphiura filiformis TaxID=82378 RepID=UPI003B2184F5